MTDQLKGSGLGRGLSSLIPKKKMGSSEYTGAVKVGEVGGWEEQVQEITQLSPRDIVPNRHQPRSDWREDQHFEDLAQSIGKHGILQPLVVTRNGQGKYELVAGERRLRAAKKMNFSRVPVIIRTVGELEKLELALIENIQRKDLNPIERAVAYKKLIEEFSISHDEAAKRLGKSRPVVSNTLRYLQLPSEIQNALAEGRLSEGQAKTILELKTDVEQHELFRRIVEEKLTVADARKVVERQGGKAVRTTHKGAQSEFTDVARELEYILGTKVRIAPRGKGGEIRIEYYSQEEFAAIIARLLRQ